MEIYQEHLARRKGGVSFSVDSFDGTPSLTRIGRRPLSDFNSNHRPKGTPHAKTQGEEGMFKIRTDPKTPLGVTTADKENHSTYTSSSPTSTQSFRRALKGTSPKQNGISITRTAFVSVQENVKATAIDETNRRNVSFATKPAGGLVSKRPTLTARPLGGVALGPPQRMAPKTPNSLLRTELDGDSFSELDESLLVSPPGALWNVLGASHNPSSASSTGLVIVPPHTAATIHKIATSQRKKEHTKMSWTSPPLQPRSLLQTTPESDLEGEGCVDQQNSITTTTLTDSPRIALPTTRKGVAMDLSTMFSDEKKEKQQSEVSRAIPPPHLLERLQKPTARTKATKDRKLDVAVTSKRYKPVKLALSPSNPAEDTNQVVVKRSHIESAKKKESDAMSYKCCTTESTCLLHRVSIVDGSSRQGPVQGKCLNHVTTQPETLADSTGENFETTTQKSEVLADSRDKGVAIDMSNLFCSDDNMMTIQPAMPPPHLLKRLEQRTSMKREVKPIAEKENEVPSKERSQRRHVRDIKSSDKSTLKKGPVRATRLLTSKAEGKEFFSLKNNENHICTNNTVSVVSRNIIATQSACTASEIPPRHFSKEDIAIKKSSLKNGISKFQSSIKIAREADDWAGKQCDTFVSWLNYTFQPDDDEDDCCPTQQTGLRALVIHRRLAQVRFRAADLFQGDVMRTVRNIVQSEISRGRLTIRSDRDLYADLNLRKQVTNLLLSYTTPWLRLGLEVMFGECIITESLQNQSDDKMTTVGRMRMALRRFVVDRVLSDANVLMKYTKGKTKVPSGKFEKLYREEMRSLVLYRLMVLILFLDHAKMENVLDNVPRLFTKSSEAKSSKAVLLAFCRIFLSSEGDFIKHLSRIGLQVSYVQDPIDELEFTVANLASDLRDGCCLTRMTEIITCTRFKSILRSLRLPAVSRLQKMHNVNVALSELCHHGIVIPNDLHAHHIVDAHREMVLKLMWSVIAHVCMTKLLEHGQVEHEIQNVLRSGKARRKIEGLKDRTPQRRSPDSVKSVKASSEQDLKSILFRWCKAVCSNFGLNLVDFTESFADGKALCYLVHYYHPTVLRLDEILPTSNDCRDDLSLEQALLNERENSSMVARRVTELGGIPKMLPVTDSKNPPDEKSMILCLTYMCSRLMESSEEIFATILIQACYRRYRERILQEKKKDSALVIFRVWNQYKHQYFAAQQRRYAAAVAILEDFVWTHKHSLLRMKCKRLDLQRRIFAAGEIQRYFRGVRGRAHHKVVVQRNRAAVVIQTYFRRFKAQVDVLETLLEKDAATIIQATWRALIEHRHFNNLMTSVKIVQRLGRGFLIRKDITKQHIAAMTIQQAWWNWVDYADSQIAAVVIQRRIRGILARKYVRCFASRLRAATKIQKIWRGYCQTIIFAITREFTISIQKMARGYLVRKNRSMERIVGAALMIQKTWRGFFAQVQYNLDVLDIVSIQTLVRAKMASKMLSRRRNAVACLQGAVRCALSRSVAQKLRLERAQERIQNNAAIVCQCTVRAWRAKRELFSRILQNKAAVFIQSRWRQFVGRQTFLRQVVSITAIQSFFRTVIARHQWRTISHHIRTIQSHWRMYAARKRQYACATMIQAQWRCTSWRRRFGFVISSTIAIQTTWRSFSASIKYHEYLLAALIVQTSWRRYSARLNYELDLLEIVISQSAVRRMLAQIVLRKRKISLLVLQNFARRFLACMKLRRLWCQHEEYIGRSHAATTIQCMVRLFIAKQRRFCAIRAATILAASFRRSIHRNRFNTIKQLVVRTQSLFRGKRERSKQCLLFREAALIQRNWRRFAQLAKYKKTYGNIVFLQSGVRRYICMRRALRAKAARIVLQCAARKYLAYRRVVRIQYEVSVIRSMTRAAQKIQAAYRGSQTRGEMWWKHSQATLIQAQYRGRIARVLFVLEKHDIIMVQSLVRRWLAFRLFRRAHADVVTIQAVARSWMARRVMWQLWMEKQATLARSAAALMLQCVYRGYLVRRNMAALHRMATHIQTSFRRHYQHVWYNMYLVDVTIVQCQIRRWIVQQRLKQENSSAVVIQCFARKALAINVFRKRRDKWILWESHCVASIAIQRSWRGHVARKISRSHASARKIQKTWRCFVAHVEYLVQQISVIRLQAHTRRLHAQRSFNQTKNGIVKFQAAIRGFLKREHIRFISMAAIIVQSYFRGYVKRRAFYRVRRSATLIQGVARGYLLRDELMLRHFAATEIQRVWRGFTQFCDYFVHLDAAIKLQAFVRQIHAISHVENLKILARVDWCFYNKNARKIQNGYRSYMHRVKLERAAHMFQNLVRSYFLKRRATTVDRGVKRLQAVIRARAVRRRRTKKFSTIVTRLDLANKKARKNPNLQIGYKTRHALTVIQTSKSLAEIMDAVKSLETSTRLSALCCVLFTEANAATILLDLIRSCNRSVPHVELVQCILLTLDNVSRYRKLVPSFADCNSAEIFLDKMQMFRDKDGIFCLSTSLLNCIAKCNPVVEEFCALHEHLKRLKALHQLSLRRSIPSGSNVRRDAIQKLNGMKRREHFDRTAAIRMLGVMAERFEAASHQSTKKESDRQQHFTF